MCELHGLQLTKFDYRIADIACVESCGGKSLYQTLKNGLIMSHCSDSIQIPQTQHDDDSFTNAISARYKIAQHNGHSVT